MTGTRVNRFDWDTANDLKCRKHGVTVHEIEAAVRRPHRIAPDPAHSFAETGSLAIGDGSDHG